MAEAWVPEGSLVYFLGGCNFELWPAPGARDGLSKDGGDAHHMVEGMASGECTQQIPASGLQVL